MKYTFFIEGADNVGKTTMINTFKKSEYVDKLITSRLCFSRYPTKRITQYLNEMNNKLKSIKLKIENSESDISEYIEYNNQVMNTLLSDMEDSFKNNDIIKDKDIVNIADRGFLSTYLYQYKNYLDLDKDNKHDRDDTSLFMFTATNVNAMYRYNASDAAKINVVILNNNKPELELNNTNVETIEYKKDFDSDTLLQSRVNQSINNIVNDIKDNKFKIAMRNYMHIEFHYIDIYNEIGIRKTPDKLCEELLLIINNQILIYQSQALFKK